MIQNFTLLFLSLFLFILLLRRMVDRRMKLTAHRRWCKENLEGRRRVVGELFPANHKTHHIT